jgi:membrane-associated phospholipid phosphatase
VAVHGDLRVARIAQRAGPEAIILAAVHMRRSLAVACSAACMVAAGGARADEPITAPVELHHDLRVDLPVTAGLAVATVGFRLVRDDLEPSTCRWCDGSTPGSVNAVDDWFRTGLRRQDTGPANITSYVLAFGAAPVSAATFTILAAVVDNRGNEALVDIVAVAEGGFSAMLATEILESVTLRTRPYVHAIASEDERAAVVAKTGAFHSFPAGHVVEAFGVAAASGVVASMRGYRLAPLVWIAGLTFGVATAYTRMAADRHYFTDVLAGAAIGTVVGGGVPLLFHRPLAGEPTSFLQRATIVATPLPQGQMATVGWTF